MDYRDRKHLRLKHYDYSQNGTYFVTICTRERKRILSRIETSVGPDALIGPQVHLTEIGKTVDQYIQKTNRVYDTVSIERYVIMPNHIHLLIGLQNGPMGASGPTLPQIIKAIKGMVTRSIGHTIWQDNYYEHIIRDENDLLIHWQYIDHNPACWADDPYYGEELQ